VKAMLSHGEAKAAVRVDTAKIYLEMHPDGKLNVALPEGQATPKAAGSPGSQPSSGTGELDVPCAVNATIDVRALDVEIADMTSSTGAVQRIVLKGLRLGAVAKASPDGSGTIDAIKPDQPALEWESLAVTLEEPGKPTKLLIAIDKP